MPKTLCTFFILTAGFCLAFTANGSEIDITKDDLYAYAKVTFDSGAVSNPGTTRMSYTGQTFPNAVFPGMDLYGDRSATIVNQDGFADIASFYSFSGAGIYSDSYEFKTTLGESTIPDGVSGYASAVTRVDLNFKITGGNSAIDLFASYEGATVFLGLYDKTLGTWVEELSPTTWWSVESVNDVILVDNHSYQLYGYLYAFSRFSGDPQSYFRFRFHDQFWVGEEQVE
jgi:hypothetical protein